MWISILCYGTILVLCGVLQAHIPHNQKFVDEIYLVVYQKQVAKENIYGKHLV